MEVAGVEGDRDDAEHSIESEGVPTVDKDLSRQDFLKLSGAGLAGVALLGGITRPAFGQTTYTSARDLGIRPENDGITNRENLVKALAYKRTNITFPPGGYVIDNSTAQPERGLNSDNFIVINNYEGELQMQPAARFVFTDKTRCGLYFYGGGAGANYARFYNLRTAFEEFPDARTSTQGCIEFDYLTNVVVQDADVDGSAGAGLLFFGCTNPTVRGTTQDAVKIRNTRADGLHFANCENVTVENVLVEETGDDGLAFLNYLEGPDKVGGQATNITVRRSRAGGIAVHGQRDVTIEDFTVEGTSVSGLVCDVSRKPPDGWNTRVPSNVVFRNGAVKDGGAFRGGPGPDGQDWPGQDANRNGIEYGDYYSSRETGSFSVEFDDIDVISPEWDGVAGKALGGSVTLSSIEVSNAGANATSYGSGFRFDSTKNLYLENLIARDTARAGFTAISCGQVRYDVLKAINTAKNDPEQGVRLHRAVRFENYDTQLNTQVGPLVAGGTQELHVEDTQSTPTGYKVFTYGAQSGDLGTIYDRVANGDLQIENNSNLAYTLGDATAPTVTAPTQSFFVPSTLDPSSVPVRINWSGSDDSGGSGIASYELQQSVNGGAYSDVALPTPTTTSVDLLLAPGSTYLFRVRATDNAGNTGAWVAGSSFALSADQENSAKVAYSPFRPWTREAIAGSYGGYVTYRADAGGYARFTFTGREFAWVSTKAENRGKADVYVDGVKQTTVDLYSGPNLTRQVVFRKTFAASGSHTLEVRPLGTKNTSSSWTRVDIDAFVSIA